MIRASAIISDACFRDLFFGSLYDKKTNDRKLKRIFVIKQD